VPSSNRLRPKPPYADLGPETHRWLWLSRGPVLAGLGVLAITLVSMTPLRAAALETADATPSLLQGYSFRSAHKRSRLPKYLKEVSGLARISKQHVLLHHDNNARVWSFDTGNNRLDEVPRQDQPVKGDFEGIAMFNNTVVLAASNGSIKRLESTSKLTREGTDRAANLQLSELWIDLPFKNRCNFEGLAIITNKDNSGTLLMPCKYPHFEQAGYPAADDKLLYLFRHRLRNNNVDPGIGAENHAAMPTLTVNVEAVLKAYRLHRLRPSAIEVVNQRLLILAGKERVLLETDLQGALIAWRRLPWLRHRQAEGLTFMPNGTLVIADEGRWLGGTITQYKPKFTSAD